MKTAIESLANYSANISYKQLPNQIVERVKKLLLHHIAVAVTSSANERNLDAPQTALGLVRDDLAISGKNTIISHDFKTKPTSAAFVNSVLMHSIQQEDTTSGGLGRGWHPGPIIIPTVMAMAEYAGASGADTIAATVLAYEIGLRLSEPTLTTKRTPFRFPYFIFGATAAASKLLGLTEEQIALALGNASEFPAGLGRLWMTEGTIGAIISMANLAQNSVISAFMGKHGAPSSRLALEHDDGFYKTYSGEKPTNLGKLLSDFRTEYYVKNMICKPHTSVTSVQTAIDITINAMKQYSIAPAEASKIELTVASNIVTPGLTLNTGPFPSVYSAFFSMPFAVTLAAKYGKVQVEEMLHFRDVELLKFAKSKVKINVTKERKGFSTKIDITTKDRGHITREQNGFQERSGESIKEALRQHMPKHMPQSNLDKIIEHISNLENLNNFTQLTRYLA